MVLNAVVILRENKSYGNFTCASQTYIKRLIDYYLCKRLVASIPCFILKMLSIKINLCRKSIPSLSFMEYNILTFQVSNFAISIFYSKYNSFPSVIFSRTLNYMYAQRFKKYPKVYSFTDFRNMNMTQNIFKLQLRSC